MSDTLDKMSVSEYREFEDKVAAEFRADSEQKHSNFQRQLQKEEKLETFGGLRSRPFFRVLPGTCLGCVFGPRYSHTCSTL